MSEYYLRSHVRLTVAGGDAILIDMRRGDYLGLSAAQSATLSGVVQGWPVPSLPQRCRPADDGGELIRALLQRSLLTRDPRRGRDARPAATIPGEERLVDRDRVAPPTILIRHGVTLLRAYVIARASLRARTLAAVVRSVGRRKSRGDPRDRGVDLQAARELVNVFFHLRPFVYSWKDRCLLDSLVLIEFLAAYGIYADWFIGVRSQPFLAHSWVQLGRYVLNDRPGAIQAFSPIVVT